MASKPKKSLGQNFLTSVGAIQKILASADYQPGLTILEVGPGRGVLTEALLKKFDRVVAIEKDRELIAFLRDKFEKELASGKLNLIEEDVLKTNPKDLGLEKYSIVANIPYYITGQFLRQWLSPTGGSQPKYMVLMLQKEVAKRIVASDGKESLLSVSIKLYGKPEYIETIKRGSFHPIPNVDSAILKIADISRPNIDEKLFFEILKAGFSHKRKLLAKNLKEVGDPTSKFNICRIDPRARAEDLKLEDWICLTEENL